MEKTWLKQYPAGVPAEIDVAQYASLVALLDESFRRYADAVAYKFMGKSITFRQVDEASVALAAWLQAQGFVKGDRIAVMLPNVRSTRWRSPASCAPGWWWSTSIRSTRRASSSTSSRIRAPRRSSSSRTSPASWRR
jgi:acyl-CoA synthetase (AMP-forming)/AMP-acid ligase II